MDCKLIAFDMDGTFLDSAKNIPQKNMYALMRAAERGIHLVPATGRIYTGIPEALRALPFMRYYICINGAYVYDALEDKTIYEANVPLADALRFYEEMDRLPVMYDCYQDNFGFITRTMYENADEYVFDPGILRLVKLLRTPVDELKAYLAEKGESVQKLQVYFKDLALRDRELERLPRLFPELLFSTSVSNNIEVNSGDAGKGKGLEALCHALGIGLENVIAFGDSSNDDDMLATAGLGIAMANALESTKRVSNAVTLSNDECGVAAAIEKYVFGA